MVAVPAARFRRVAILGTGLIGGSFGLAVRGYLNDAQILGWDREPILRQAESRCAIHKGFTELASALAGADLVYVALPIGTTLDLLPEIARHVNPQTLVTDACSTKAVVCRAAAAEFKGSARFLGGHPMAGKEVSGIEHADADLFRGAKYALIGAEDAADAGARDFAALVEDIGARPVWLDADTHDWAVAIVSHLPQLLAVALAALVRDETNETGLPLTLAGRGLRDALRLAGSPYSIWRDVALTNSENIGRALDRVGQAIEHLRLHLKSRELADEFAAANEVYKILREMQ